MAGAKRHRLEPWGYVKDVLDDAERGAGTGRGPVARPLGSEPSRAGDAPPPGGISREGPASRCEAIGASQREVTQEATDAEVGGPDTRVPGYLERLHRAPDNTPPLGTTA